MLHYTNCGLDYVYLVSGYEIVQTKYGEGLSIKNVDGLFQNIAVTLITRDLPICGAELRFLRKRLDMSQAELGVMLGADEQRISRWERGTKKPIPKTADKLVRIVAANHIERRLMDEILNLQSELDELQEQKLTFEHKKNHWQQSHLEAA